MYELSIYGQTFVKLWGLSFVKERIEKRWSERHTVPIHAKCNDVNVRGQSIFMLSSLAQSSCNAAYFYHGIENGKRIVIVM